MPETEVIFFADDDGSAPAKQWLAARSAKVQEKCIKFVERLSEKGYELRRPNCDYLRDDIYELRVGRQGINYRLLYFFYEQIIVISHGLIKEQEVQDQEIDRAIRNRTSYISNPTKHTYGRRVK